MLLSKARKRIEPKLYTWLQLNCFTSQSERISYPICGCNADFSRHKFASNVVEKSIAHGNDEQRREIVKMITTARSDGSSPLQVLMRDQYGNYVIRMHLLHPQVVYAFANIEVQKNY